MATRKHKIGLELKVGDEISLYQNEQVRTGIVCFIGKESVSVLPTTAEVLGAEGETLRDVEYIVNHGEII